MRHLQGCCHFDLHCLSAGPRHHRARLRGCPHIGYERAIFSPDHHVGRWAIRVRSLHSGGTPAGQCLSSRVDHPGGHRSRPSGCDGSHAGHGWADGK
jgi:hypothetical protein